MDCALDPALKAKLVDAVTKAHVALGCRDYSLYDFRVDPEGNIFFLEVRRDVAQCVGRPRAAVAPRGASCSYRVRLGCVRGAQASLFCCFAPNSVICLMASATGRPELQPTALFKTMVRRALARKPDVSEVGLQTLGSKPKKSKTVSVPSVEARSALPMVMPTAASVAVA